MNMFARFAPTRKALALVAGPTAPSSHQSAAPLRGRADPRSVAADEPPAGLTPDDWSRVRSAIQASSYHAAPVVKAGEASALVAPNREHGYRTTFRPAGIEIARQARSEAWRLSLAITGYGRAARRGVSHGPASA